MLKSWKDCGAGSSRVLGKHLGDKCSREPRRLQHVEIHLDGNKLDLILHLATGLEEGSR